MVVSAWCITNLTHGWWVSIESIQSIVSITQRGAIQRRVFCVTGLGGLYLEGLIHRGAYFRNFTVVYVSSYVLPRERVTRITRSKGNPNVLHLTIKHVRLILFKAFFQTGRKNNGHSRK